MPTLYGYKISSFPQKGTVVGGEYLPIILAGVNYKITIDQIKTYVQSFGGTATWGAIVGTLSSQSDLNTALGLKANTASLGTVAALSYPGGTANFLRADGTFAAPPGGGSGDFSGPAGATSGNLVSFNGATGKLGADSGLPLANMVAMTATATSGRVMTSAGGKTIQDGGTLLSAFALLSSPALTGTPTAPTATPGTNTTQLATTAYADAIAALKANIASPSLTGTPLSITAAVDTNTTQIATTAYVVGQAAGSNPLINGTAAIGTSLRYARQDHVHPSSGIPQNSQSAAYTLTIADANQHIYHPSADTTARIWTIPANSSVAYPIGTTLTFVNDTSAGAITIAITTDTMVLAGAGTTGSRTLAANGIATALKMTATRWQINGTGVT